jgi:hypothetical protein
LRLSKNEQEMGANHVAMAMRRPLIQSKLLLCFGSLACSSTAREKERDEEEGAIQAPATPCRPEVY